MRPPYVILVFATFKMARASYSGLKPNFSLQEPSNPIDKFLPDLHTVDTWQINDGVDKSMDIFRARVSSSQNTYIWKQVAQHLLESIRNHVPNRDN
jgi:hypothetical protein